MTQYIHYEENIFMLNDLLRHIERSLKIDIDSNVFLEKIKSDLIFAEGKLSSLYEALKDSTLQLDKIQYFRHLYKTKSLFLRITDSILNKSIGRSLDFSDFLERLREAEKEQEFEQNDIESYLAKTDNSDMDTNLISQEELMFLMSGNISDEEDVNQ
ncbi:MAG: hypothetical protein L3J12_04005 [Spirochaetales bacterium]|nr:hypothetical protein [Spirochaetales bacterium]